MTLKWYDSLSVLTGAVAFLALIALGGLLHVTQSFMIPFVIAVLLSFLLVPLADGLTRLHCPPVLANILVVLLCCIVLSGLIVILYGAAQAIASEMPRYTQAFSAKLEQVMRLLHTAFGLDVRLLRFSPKDLLTMLSPESIVQAVNQSVGTFISIASKAALMLIFLIFIVAGRRVLIDKVYHFLHATGDSTGTREAFILSMARQIKAYLWLKTLTSLGTGVVFGLTAYVLGLDFPIFWGFLSFLCNFIPTIGPIIVAAPAIGLALLQFNSLAWAAFAAFVLSGVLFVIGSFIEPRIMGDRLNLNIIAILLSLLLWGLIWGVAGMFLAVPITALLNILCLNVPRLRDWSILLSR